MSWAICRAEPVRKVVGSLGGRAVAPSPETDQTKEDADSRWMNILLGSSHYIDSKVKIRWCEV